MSENFKIVVWFRSGKILRFTADSREAGNFLVAKAEVDPRVSRIDYSASLESYEGMGDD